MMLRPIWLLALISLIGCKAEHPIVTPEVAIELVRQGVAEELASMFCEGEGACSGVPRSVHFDAKREGEVYVVEAKVEHDHNLRLPFLRCWNTAATGLLQRCQTMQPFGSGYCIKTRTHGSEGKRRWQSVVCGHYFALKLPTTMVQRFTYGIDSFVARYEDPRTIVRIDYGWYSNPLDLPDSTCNLDYQREKKALGGKQATLVKYRIASPGSDLKDVPYVAGAHFSTEALGTTMDTLTVWTFSKDTVGQATAMRMLETITFPSPIPRTGGLSRQVVRRR